MDHGAAGYVTALLHNTQAVEREQPHQERKEEEIPVLEVQRLDRNTVQRTVPVERDRKLAALEIVCERAADDRGGAGGQRVDQAARGQISGRLPARRELEAHVA